MKKKMNELRMTIINTILLLSFLGYALMQLSLNNKIGMIGGVCMTFIAFILLASRYKHVIYEDMMIIYEWKVAAMLPSLVMYSDIVKVEQISKFHVVIEHKYKSHVYVFNAKKFIDTYESLKK